MDYIIALMLCTKKKDVAEAVLIRAIEPINELDYISNIRYNKKYDELTKAQSKNLTNGPSKFMFSLFIK